MIKLINGDLIPPGVKYTMHAKGEIFCYFADDPEIIELVSIEADRLIRNERSRKKESRTQLIKNITVTTSNGHIFNGDETSQQRIARSVMVMDEMGTIPWTLADNTIAPVTKSELTEALKLSIIKQTELWNIDNK